ncbi:hypothetical protein LNKW23_04630 [Paralimibaculum aggregatum]|uniref:ABC transmembrane type-1 domain-containing protein n=1 Tax=Paralimibaculum aggregatum TaxID=3036245 RepID=A0ABQ6LLT7_9RHOB|nr:hypothetical protein [Limibaculum sp. NKW23]GMG81250.1 hypothetical protein LNKW23_04630 [Limibaculum sp. NKW23]
MGWTSSDSRTPRGQRPADPRRSRRRIAAPRRVRRAPAGPAAPGGLEREILRAGAFGQLAICALALGIMPIAYAAVSLPKHLIDLLRMGDGPAGACMLQTRLLQGVALGLAVLALHGAAKYLLNILRIRAAERMRRRLRLRVLRGAGSGGARRQLGPVLTQELEIIGGLASELVATPLLQIGTLAVVLLFLGREHVALAAISGLIVAANIVALRPLQQRASEIARERIGLVRQLNGQLIDLAPIAGVLRDCAALERLRLRHGRIKFLLKLLANLMVGATPLILIGAGGLLAAMGELSLGALVAAVLAQREIGPAVRALIAFENTRIDARARYAKLFPAAPGPQPGPARPPRPARPARPRRAVLRLRLRRPAGG